MTTRRSNYHDRTSRASNSAAFVRVLLLGVVMLAMGAYLCGLGAH